MIYDIKWRNKEFVPQIYLISDSSHMAYCIKNEINGEWLKDQLMNSLETLQSNKFNARGIVCDNHASNVSAFMPVMYLPTRSS